jgi:DnaD/phage-associated family protein
MQDRFEIEFEFMENWGRFAKAEYLQIYLFMLYIWKKDGKILAVSEVAKKLDKDRDLVDNAIEFWITAGVLSKKGRGYTLEKQNSADNCKEKQDNSRTKNSLRERPSYDSAEIDAVASVNKEIDYLFNEAEKILGKILSPSDFELFYSFVDWLGLPVEVVIMLLRFAVGQGKTGKRYLETVAIDWADKGIDNYESAEAYIREIEIKLSNEGKVRSILGIYDRALTQTEKKYIKQWTHEKNISIELIAEAYERTVMATGKLSWAYMNKILLSWVDDGLSTVDAVREQEAIFKLKSAPAKVKINSKKDKFHYEDTNKPDYTNFAEQILNDMLAD